jgi:hypothetical protein
MFVNTPKPGQNLVSRSGNYRIQYDPDWSKAFPYKIYWRGTAGRIFSALRTAMIYCGDDFDVPLNWM